MRAEGGIGDDQGEHQPDPPTRLPNMRYTLGLRAGLFSAVRLYRAA
jgi:hypothetical protein